MSGRHARTPEPPSTAGTLAERATRRPMRVAVVLATGVALAAPMVAASPLASPDPVGTAEVEASVAELKAAVETAATQRLTAPGEGPVNTIGFVTALAATKSSQEVDAGATYLSASMIAVREAAEREAAERAEAERQAAERVAQEAREAEEARAAAAQPAPAVTSGSVWDRLAQCESGGNWAINTGNGYYGGLQFSLSSWRGVGGVGYPHQASRETQIAMGERLRASGGWGHWPACSRKLGLR